MKINLENECGLTFISTSHRQDNDFKNILIEQRLFTREHGFEKLRDGLQNPLFGLLLKKKKNLICLFKTFNWLIIIFRTIRPQSWQKRSAILLGLCFRFRTS